MPTLARGAKELHQLGDVRIVFEGVGGSGHDITDGELLRTIQRGELVRVGTRVRVTQHDDRGSWFEIWRIAAIEPRGHRYAVA